MRALITIIIAIMCCNYCISVKTKDSSANGIVEYSEDYATEVADVEDMKPEEDEIVFAASFAFGFYWVIKSGLCMKIIVGFIYNILKLKFA